MSKDQEDFLNMGLTALALLDVNNNITGNNIPFNEVKAEAQAIANEIIDLQGKQDTDNSGIKQDKDKNRAVLEGDILEASSIMAFYASRMGNQALHQQVD